MSGDQTGSGHRRLHGSHDGELARRDFLRLLIVASGALAVSTGVVAAGVFRRHGGSHAAKRIAQSIPPGEAITFSYPGPDDPAIAVKLADGTLVGYSSVCTHLQCAVLWRKEEGRLACPCHEGIFDPRSGAVLAGPPPRPLPKITLEQHPDGIYATGAAG